MLYCALEEEAQTPMNNEPAIAEPWPALPFADWRDTVTLFRSAVALEVLSRPHR